MVDGLADSSSCHTERLILGLPSCSWVFRAPVLHALANSYQCTCASLSVCCIGAYSLMSLSAI